MSVRQTWRLVTDRVREIRGQRGTGGLLKAGFRFLASPVYKSESFWLTVAQLSADYKSEASRPRIGIDQLTFKAVTSNDEADRLEAEGFSFRRHPTYFNYNLKVYTHWLDCGAVACCTFVGKEFAAINWAITSQRTRDALKVAPLKIDFANHEATTRGAWVSPKHRGLEIYNFTTRNRNRFLLDRGFTVSKNVIDFSNRSGRGISSAAGTRVYGTGQRVRVFLRWTFWKEHHFERPVDWSEADRIAGRQPSPGSSPVRSG